MMKTTHWTWESKAFDVPWRDTPVTIGKINQINNFCIGSQGNENKCMSCHAGYGWEARQTKPRWPTLKMWIVSPVMPILAPTAKGLIGNPADGVDLLAAATIRPCTDP